MRPSRRVASILSALVFGYAAVAPLRAADVVLSWRAVAGERPLTLVKPELLRVGQNELSLTRLSALVSSVAFVRPDGSFAQLEGQFGALALDQNRAGFTLRGVPDGRYIGLQFLVGLRPEANHADPGQWPAGHALNPLVNELHWSWQGGYIFLALEGRYRRPDGALGGWSLHIANDPRLTLIELPHPLEIRGDTTVTLDVDLARLLAKVVLSPEKGDSTHSAPGDKLADQLVENIPQSFRVASVSANRVAPSDVAASASEPTSAVTPRASSSGSPPPSGATPLAFNVPPGFPQISLPADNPLTAEGVALGERLFHDPRLSGTGAQSCASCHEPARAFSDHVALSVGADGRPGTRNAMPLFNLAWNSAFAWDGSQPRIRDQALAAMTSELEMHARPERVVAALATDAGLADAFRAAFGTPDVTFDRIGRALEQYLLTLVSSDSKFDRVMRGAAEFTEDEREGFALFSMEFDPAHGRRGADCFHCHGGVLFSDYSYKNTGLDLDPRDRGRERVSGTASDRGKFKTPSLRNVAVTAPYMHDGRFATLEDVIAHYDHGVKRTDILDPNLAKHPDGGLEMTARQRVQLVAFLRTLTDRAYEESER